MKKIQFIEKVFSFLGYISNVIGTTVLLIIVGHLLLGVAIYVRHINRIETAALPVYDNYPDEGEFFWKEHERLRIHFEPYYHWRRDGFQGKYINISDDGVRHSVTLKYSKNAKKIFMFGGSTLWGSGTRDEHTIPSFLQSFLGKDYKIYNYGEHAYVSTQEINFLLHQLANGNIPDAVIFYDGANDAYTGVYSPAIPRGIHNLRMENVNVFVQLYNTSNYKRLIDYFFKTTNKWDDEVSSKIKNNSSSVVELYESHIKQVNALGKEYSFKTFFFWQPYLFSGTRDTLPYEKAIVQNASPVFVESLRQVYLDAKNTFKNRENEQIFFFGDIFNQVREPIYMDWCHLGPNGNEIVARQMFDKIKDLL